MKTTYGLPMTSNQAADLANDAHAHAQKARSMAVYLDSDANSQEAAKQWHFIADSLFEAVALYDKMATRSN
jgi:hypothetical protein